MNSLYNINTVLVYKMKIRLPKAGFFYSTLLSSAALIPSWDSL